MPNSVPLVAMTSGGPHAWIMINALRDHFGTFPVLQEQAEPAEVFWKRRRRLLGPLKVASMQAARLPMRMTKIGTGKKIASMVQQYGLRHEPDPSTEIIQVSSINDEDTRTHLQSLSPKVVFVVSTRIIGESTLQSLEAPFINYHSGINPAYRGMFGGYFALANQEPDKFGATVHLVDAGVDTGGILYQSHIEIERGDNFHTYLWRMAAGSREIVVQAIEDALAGELKPFQRDLPSTQYFAPTLGGYISTGLFKGVW